MERMRRWWILLVASGLLAGLIWSAWRPIGSRVVVDFEFDEVRLREKLDASLETAGLAKREWSGNRLTIESDDSGATVVSMIRESARLADRLWRRARFEEEQEQALLPLRTMQSAKKNVIAIIEDDLGLQCEDLGGFDTAVEVLTWTATGQHRDHILSNLRHSKPHHAKVYRAWSSLKDLEGEALLEAVSDLDPDDATWQALREKPDVSVPERHEMLLTCAETIQANMETTLQMANHPGLRPTLGNGIRAAYQRYVEAITTYEQARRRWANTPVKYTTEWADLEGFAIRWHVASVLPFRRFQPLTRP